MSAAKYSHANRQSRALAAKFTMPVPTVEQRIEAGKKLRDRVPRAAHAELKLSRQRDPIGIILEQAKTRLPSLVPLRNVRMLASPFAFLRGSAAVMAADLAGTPDSGLRVQACGDMHVSNFGLFASAERHLIFGINDFDETAPGPWEWDLKRLAASAQVAARHLGAGKKVQQEAVRETVSSYQRWIRRYSVLGYMTLWYARIDSKEILAALSEGVREEATRIMEKARIRDNLQMLEHVTDIVNDKQRIVESRPFIVRETQADNGMPIREMLGIFLEAYIHSLPLDRRVLLERYRIVDVARKVVGVGSVGTRCWMIFFKGIDDNDPLFLQVKEAQPSVLAKYFPAKAPPGGEGRRVVAGQRLIQGSPDIFLGWGQVGKTQFYVRQLRDMKGGVELEPERTTPAEFVEYCGLCGWGLALAHAKSGDAAMISGYIGKSDELETALVKYAAGYAQVTETDYATMKAAARAKKIPVARGAG